MKKIMTLIDLLVKVANKEKLPNKIKFNKRICELDKNNIYRFIDYEREPLIYELLPSGDNLNDEVEILDDEKFEDIEEIEHEYIYGLTENEEKIDDRLSKFEEKINQLIKNQNRIIERLKESEYE